MRTALILLLTLNVATLASGQGKAPARKYRATAPQGPSKAKLTADQALGWRLLKDAEVHADSLEPATRAFTLSQIARAYIANDKVKAQKLYRRAFDATRTIGTDGDRLAAQARRELQSGILVNVAELDPAAAEPLLDQADPRARDRVLGSLVGYYADHRNIGHAIQLLDRLSGQSEPPYSAVGRVLYELKPGSPERQQIFANALNAFLAHQQSTPIIGPDDFGTVTVEFHKSLPSALVMQAVDALLEQARRAGKDELQQHIAVSSAKGAVQFNSAYDYRLFQLLPAIRDIDPGRADALLKVNQSTRMIAGRYPQGLSAVAPDLTNFAPAKSGTSGSDYSFSVDYGNPQDATAALPENHSAEQIMAMAAKNPRDAIANVPLLPSAGQRVRTYLSIARTSLAPQPGVTSEALDHASDELKSNTITSSVQILLWRNIADLFLKLGNTAHARSAIDHGMQAAKQTYREDTDPDDPNSAAKPYWPSASAWRNTAMLSAKISPTWSLELLKEIPDDDMRLMSEAWIALSLLHVQTESAQVLVQKKDAGKGMVDDASVDPL
jgi:hypothetical protein